MHKFAKPLTIILFILLILPGITEAQEAPGFGQMTVTLDDGSPQIFPIQEALLYRQVKLVFDSTAIVQNKKGDRIYFYPQLDKGSGDLLRLILGKLPTEKEKNNLFFDLFIELGDSLPDSLVWRDADSGVVFLPNGILLPGGLSPGHINGIIRLTHIDENKEVSGNLNLSFDLPFSLPGRDIRHVKLTGDYKVPVGEYRSTSISTVTQKEEMKGRYRRNIYLAVIMTVFLLAIFGLQ